jgi:hypothetical protein
MSKPTRIDENLLPLVDKAIKVVKDDLGLKKYNNRTEFISEAVKEHLLKMSIVAEVTHSD